MMVRIWGEMGVGSRYKKYEDVGIESGVRGGEVGELMMKQKGIRKVGVEGIGGRIERDEGVGWGNGGNGSF